MKAVVAILAALVCLGVLFWFYTAPKAPPAEMTEAEIAQIEAEVLKATNDMMTAWNAEDGLTGGSYFDSETLNVLWGSNEYDNPESFGEMWATIWERFPSWDGGWDDSTVKVLNPNQALFRGRYHCTLTDQEGVQTFWRPHLTALFERRADGWKMTLVDHAIGTAQEVPTEG
jgi:ketosteroid isomerase-like protein